MLTSGSVTSVKAGFLIDTDIMVSVLRHYPPAVALAADLHHRWISVITYLELIHGARGKAEIRALKSYLSEYAFQVLPLTEGIGHRAMVYMEEHCPAAGLGPCDALIAATATEHNLTLLTANSKHYKMIADLPLKSFRP